MVLFPSCKFNFSVFENLLDKSGKTALQYVRLSVTYLKVQSCKLCNNKHMIASTRITTTEGFAFIADIVFNLSSRKVLFINRKGNRNS